MNVFQIHCFEIEIVQVRLKMFETIRTGGKKDEKIINVQDGIRPYRTEKQSKINKWYMYLYSRLKSSTNFTVFLITHIECTYKNVLELNSCTFGIG